MNTSESSLPITQPGARTLQAGILVNAVYMAVELLVGWRQQSYGLMADAGFNLCDLFSMGLALVWLRGQEAMSCHARRDLRRLDAMLLTACMVVVLVAAGLLAAGSLQRFSALAGFDGFAVRGETDGLTVCLTATAGIAVNGLTALLLTRRMGGGRGMRRALRVLGADALVSVAVALGGLAAWLQPSYGVVDAALGTFIALLMVAGAVKMLYPRLL